MFTSKIGCITKIIGALLMILMTSFTSFSQGWAIVFEKKSQLNQEVFVRAGDTFESSGALDFVKQQWDAGNDIVHISKTQGIWTVVSQSNLGLKQWINHIRIKNNFANAFAGNFGTLLNAKISDAYFLQTITEAEVKNTHPRAIKGHAQAVVVMSRSSRDRKVSYTLFEDSIWPKRIIQDYWEKGYKIHYANRSEYSSGLFYLAFEKASYRQTYRGRPYFPHDAISDQRDRGYYVSSLVNSGGDNWIAVFSKGFRNQKIHYTGGSKSDNNFPHKVISDFAQQGYYIKMIR